MKSTLDTNKRIAKNTLFLYLRMGIIMIVNLFVVRVVLKILGAEDYGIYNVVGGVVSMFTFLNSTLSASCQRFFSYEIGRDNKKGLDNLFSLIVTFFLIFIAVVVVIIEIFGYWMVNTQLTIPYDRIVAANWVFQISIISFAITILSVPYNAFIIAHEKMSAYAYLSITEAVLKLCMIFVLSKLPFDKLILYSLFMFSLHALITFSYYLYCRLNFKESKFHIYWDKKEMMKVFSFTGWHFIGSVSVIIRGQGINILLNMFFNPVINTARAIAYQINTAIDSLSNNFFVAVKPQIYKLYSVGDTNGMNLLVVRSTKFCFFLMLILALPVYMEASYLLNLWLDNFPDYTLIFVKLVIINALIDSSNGPAIASALATGNIKKFELITGGVMIMNLPLSYLFLKFGFEPQITMIISIFISLLTIVTRSIILNKITALSLRTYYIDAIFPLILILFASSILPFTIHKFLDEGYIRLLIIIVVSFISILFSFYFIGLSTSEKTFVKTKISTVLSKYF